MKKLIAFSATFVIIIGTLVLSNRETRQVEQPSIVDPVKLATLQDSLNSINQEELKKILYWLASPELEGRMSAKKGNDTAKDYLVSYFQNLGYETTTQEFSVQNLNNHKETGTGKTCNVIASLAGNDPNLSKETVIMGAHFDHIGYGPSMSRSPNRREIHPGADDNASGTTALLGAAKALSKMKGQNKRRLVFICFSAEEMGLIGSRHYVSTPVYPNAVFMLNMDMVGRYRNKGAIDAIGAGSSTEVKSILTKLTGYPFKPNISSGAGGGSDHAPFFQKSIPVCFLHTGMHNDYHTPDDTPEKIDYEGLTWVSKYSANILWEVCQLPSKPVFRGTVIDDVEFFDHDWKKDWK